MICSINNFDNLIFTSNTDKVGEISMDFYEKDISSLIEKLAEYSDKRVVLDIDKPRIKTTDIEDYQMISNVYKNVVYRIGFNKMEDFRKTGLPFFFKSQDIVASTFDELITYCEMGITDIYVKGEICFSLDRVREIADKHNIKIRVYPNVIQYSGYIFSLMPNPDPLTAFWIRPGDLHLYEKYIDIIEFFCEDDLQQTYYDMYFTETGYIGNLSIAIDGMIDIKNTTLPPQFTEFRINCRKRCQFNECHKCHKFAALAKLMEENNIELEKEEEGE